MACDLNIAPHIALAFWQESGAGALAQVGDFAGCRKRINGGHLGLDDVIRIAGKIIEDSWVLGA